MFVTLYIFCMSKHPRIYPIEYKGHTIIYTDWSHIADAQEFCEIIKSTSEHLVTLQQFNLLELIDVRETNFSKDVLITLQHMAKKTRPFNKKKAVVAHFSPTRLFILRTINQFSSDKIEPFHDMVDAKEWLIL